MTVGPVVKPGGPLCGDALRETADWLDTYDELAQSYFDLLERLGLRSAGELATVRGAASGTEQQNDLRRWADELDALEQDGQINYDGPDPSVECAHPPCTNRLRESDFGGLQWCSKEHRRLTLPMLRP